MPAFTRSDLADLNVFTTIVRRRSFKAAAIELGVTGSALSHTIRRLEERLGTKLLNRTNRTVVPTAVGLDLAAKLEAGFQHIGAALSEVEGLRLNPAGELRLNIPRDASHLLVGPALPDFTARFPAVRLVIVVDDRPVDVIAEGFDAGIRYGDTIPDGMIAVALTPPLRWVVVGSPGYLREHGRPRAPEDLKEHRCIRLLLGNSSVYKWELGEGESLMRIDVQGPCAVNDTQTTIEAALNGVGLAYVLERRVRRELEDGGLEVVLPDWASPGPGFHMYYPGRKPNHPALKPLIDIIRRQHGLRSHLAAG
ncbi:LysR family transcriptional regulator [Azospirillum sp. SYSU D00513]|uniref:LysR family transcriptional regulator n=1 Tax=Azospirillum sp. SYSU D00513 TaxID=2812561 RepID=UPI001A97AE45|nr:LysR family transcriptional regulator [Azospirillum sp. SYSU D00513]